MSERVCVIHAGTHKTGTTSLQYFLEMNSAPLESAGIAFAKTGWHGVVPGNHEVAWELLQGDFTRKVSDTLNELAEVHSSASVVLSAEDFSLLHAQPQHIARFAELIRGLGFTPKILVYLREQSGFAESMYAERVKHGFVQRFEDYVEQIVNDGFHDALGSNIEFRYDLLLDVFTAAVGAENVLVRPYIRNAPNAAIVHDFLASLEALAPDFRAAGLNLRLHPARVNESLTFGALVGNVFVRLRPNEPVPEDAKTFFDTWAPGISEDVLNSRFRLLHRSDVARFAAAFAASNERVAQRFGVVVPPFAESNHEDITDFQRELLAHYIEQWSSKEQPESDSNQNSAQANTKRTFR